MRNKKAKHRSSRRLALIVSGTLAPAIAAEGLERPCETRGNPHQADQGEAKPEAAFADATFGMKELADCLADGLSSAELIELLDRLKSRLT